MSSQETTSNQRASIHLERYKAQPRSRRPVLEVVNRVIGDILYRDGKGHCRCECYVTRPTPY